MSIKVKVIALVAWHNDLADQIRVEKINEVAEDFADLIRTELGDLKCSTHPRKNSQIIIIADRTNQLIIKKKFCCAPFEKKVSLKIDR